MRWQAPTIVIAMPISAMCRARSAVDVRSPVGCRRTPHPAKATSATCSTGSNTSVRA